MIRKEAVCRIRCTGKSLFFKSVTGAGGLNAGERCIWKIPADRTQPLFCEKEMRSENPFPVLRAIRFSRVHAEAAETGTLFLFAHVLHRLVDGMMENMVNFSQ